jgi:hypothetical protein
VLTMVAVAALERCCHSAATRLNRAATRIKTQVSHETGLQGNGLTSRSEPESYSVPSCHLGNVLRKGRQTAVRMMLMNLTHVLKKWKLMEWGGPPTSDR